MRTLLITLLLLPSLAIADDILTRKMILDTMQNDACKNQAELECLEVSAEVCNQYIDKVVSDCQNRLTDEINLSNITSEQQKGLENFHSCASQHSQAILGVSPDKAKRCAAAN